MELLCDPVITIAMLRHDRRGADHRESCRPARASGCPGRLPDAPFLRVRPGEGGCGPNRKTNVTPAPGIRSRAGPGHRSRTARRGPARGGRRPGRRRPRRARTARRPARPSGPGPALRGRRHRPAARP
ncbi:hypothetical protein E6U81_03855 [Streptomyces sp. A0592]|nr:hypothetical protein E6U81_03855 [Streptomyces sp. A0592]